MRWSSGHAIIIITLGLLLPRADFLLQATHKLPFDKTPMVTVRSYPANPIPASQLRGYALHDGGLLYCPIGCALFPPYQFINVDPIDPETGMLLGKARYPKGSNFISMFCGALWIGGIVDEDTLVSVGYDGWFGSILEFWPPDPEQGGLIRTGRYADDEFVAVYTDTVTGPPYIDDDYPLDDTTHIPLGLKITQTSYSWRDSLYDNFVILDFTVENIGPNLIREGWAGIIFDADIYADTGSGSSWEGYQDDASGFLDTVFNGGDPGSRLKIAYSFDRDGDPSAGSTWEEYSARYVISLALLGTTIDNPTVNFNWWLSCGNPALDFGPRRIGTPEDPFRVFTDGGGGTASKQEDKYYLMSHPEVDYNHLEMMVHDSSDGWLPATQAYDIYIHDAKFLYSFGPFDLAPGDSISFAIAISGSDNLHVNAEDYAQYYSPSSPYEYQARLDFTEMLINHRRADSVYRSGFTLPRPGPPVGLRVVDYDDDYVHLIWNSSSHPDRSGYYLSVKDTVYSDNFYHVFPDSISDTSYVFEVTNPTHTHFFAVSVVDTNGWESQPSLPIEITPARPETPQDLAYTLDSLTPILSWRPGDDTGLAAYIVYRAVWDEPFIAYDSTIQTQYRDEQAESGIRYSYRVIARHECGAESPPTDSVSVLPMALDKGVVFYNMDNDIVSPLGPYKRSYVDRLYYSMPPASSIRYHHIDDRHLSFKDMADYSVIVFISEKRGGRFLTSDPDSIYIYLSHGGRALFIIPNASTEALSSRPPVTRIYDEGTLFRDILKLDSALINSVVLDGGFLCGDLTGCSPVSSQYPALGADSAKLAGSLLPLEGYIPLSGGLYPSGEAEILYRYQSSFPDSIFHDLPNGIAYSDDTCRWVFFNFPLSLMEAPANIIAFHRALEYLGVDLTCGDITEDGSFDICDAVRLIDYLFRDGPLPDEHRADVNCDGSVDMADALAIINVIFREGPGLNCCR